MSKQKIKDYITQIRGVSYKPADVVDAENGTPIIRANNIQDDGMIYDDLVFVTQQRIKDNQLLKKGDIVICTSSGSKNLVGKATTFNGYKTDMSFGAFCKGVRISDSSVNPDFIRLFFKSKTYREQISASSTGANINNIKTEHIDNLLINIPPVETQNIAVGELITLIKSISIKKQQLSALNDLVKSRFIEMFGDFETNSMDWEIKPFSYFASIDGNMTSDFEKYADYPHIGVGNIEKDTGNLIDYKTIKEYNVISGKYLFTPEHIIYSKIRPNLNKVALPAFDGLCSADAYPILPNKDNCDRIFLAIAMRSEYFLSYILQFSSRANMPKVNRKEISGFTMPLPPLSLQNEFAEFVNQTDKSKFVCLVNLSIFCAKFLHFRHPP